tara:strand:+ start:189 stop:956 length:768 start_codon:yes stop_codon:yes gene_type:complete
MNDIDQIQRMTPSTRKKFFDQLGYYVYALCEIDTSNRRTPFYIGKGKNDRCLSHLREQKQNEKTTRIQALYKKKRLGIDILVYEIDEPTSLAIESVCIDLLNIGSLTNAVRGHGINTKRLPINELASVLGRSEVEVLPEHRGVAFLLEKSYLHNFGDLEILEHTRGIWSRKQKEDVQFAYSTYRGIVKEVFKIYTWVPAGTQQYFTRDIDINSEKVKRRFEFVGRKASDEIRNLYVGNVIQKPRSYGDPFVKVGF